MKGAIELLGAFNSYDISDRFNHTNQFFAARRVVANITNRLVGDIEALAAKLYLFS
jgi:hypothetical protein